MSQKLDFAFKTPTLPSFQLTSPPALSSHSSSTLSSNHSALTNVNLPFTHTNFAAEHFHQDEWESIQKIDNLGKKILSLKHFIYDLDNPQIENVYYKQTFFLQIVKNDPVLYEELCKQVALARNGVASYEEGCLLLHQNFRILLQHKDLNGRNLLEQVVAHWCTQLEFQRAIYCLNSLGFYLAQAAQTNDPSQKEYLQTQAVEIFKKLPSFTLGIICEKIWQLDSSPFGNPNYGYDQALKDIQKVLLYKNVSPLYHALEAAQSKIHSKPTFSIAYSHREAILPTDSKETSRNILILYHLDTLKMLIEDPSKNNEFLRAEFEKLPSDFRNMIYQLVWQACNKPLEDRFGENLITKNFRLLSQVFKNDQGTDLLSLLIKHQQELIKAQRQLEELQQLSINSIGKSSTELGKLFISLSESTKEKLAYRVWYEEKGKNNPNLGEWDYGKKQIERNPFCFLIPLTYLLSELQQKLKNANQHLLDDLDQKCSIPEGVIDTSTNKLLQTPNLIQQLPFPLKPVFVTAEFTGVASVGGLGPAVEGMARGIGPNSRVIMPLYLNGPIADSLLNSKKEKPKYEVKHQGKTYKVFKIKVNGIRVYLIDAPEYFWIPKKEDNTSGNFYNGNWIDVKRRWAVFQSLAEQITDKMSQKTSPVNLVHVHDSQTALIPELIACRHPEEWKSGSTPATVFTFHNNLVTNAYDEAQTMDILQEIGLPRNPLNSFIKGLETSDIVTTVSEEFGKEAQTPLFGNGIHPFVKKAAFQGKVFGIVNGNSNGWDPRRDEQLKNWKSVSDGTPLNLTFGPGISSFEQWAHTLITTQRELCAFLKSKSEDDPAFADLDPEKPIVLYVGRYDSSQKGIDKLPLIMEEALKNGAQFICIGVEPDPTAKEILTKMQKRAKELNKKGVLILEDRKVNGKFIYQSVFGSLLRSASMLPIAPSLYEPCGLVQGEFNRFGKRMIATATGGFVDTLKTEGPHANGYLFKRCNQWYSQEQEEEIRKTLIHAINDAKKTMHALYHGTINEQRPFIEKMQAISDRALNSTWEKTPDHSPHAIIRLEHVYAEAFRRRKKRGYVPTNLEVFKA